jgi:hypothetical protein
MKQRGAQRKSSHAEFLEALHGPRKQDRQPISIQEFEAAKHPILSFALGM